MLLNRTLDPADYEHLTPELRCVDGYSIDGQHPHRRWEYALALHAISRWGAAGHRLQEPLYDVGGAGSDFCRMLVEYTECAVEVVDPRGGLALETFIHGGVPLADVVTCLSVIEHVPDLDRFCYYLSCLVAPGGLLVLTMDYWNRCGPDHAANRDLRQRIFCPKTYQSLRNQFVALQLNSFDGYDPTYHGAQVYDYTFASLILEKRR